MSTYDLRCATTQDLPALARLLPAWELDTASFCDGDDNDQLLLALPTHTAGAAALGCIRIRRAIGLTQPRYWFHVGYRVHAAADLGMFRRERTLMLGNDHTGSAELCNIAVDAAQLDAAQQAHLLQLLVRAALLLLHRDHRQQPADGSTLPRVIAALPGLRDERGAAPFWEGLGRHFYPDDVDAALARLGSPWFTHVAALLPRHPLVVSVLRADTQAAIGATDARAGQLLAALRGAGLRAGQHVDLRDGGPVFEAHLDLVGCPSMRRVRLVLRDTLDAPQLALLAADSGTQLCVPPAESISDDILALTRVDADRHGLRDGQSVWIDLPPG